MNRCPILVRFKAAFLDLLEGRVAEPIPDGYITGEELGLYLNHHVPAYKHVQTPQYGKINDPKFNRGDFVFRISGWKDRNKQRDKLAETDCWQGWGENGPHSCGRV